MNSSYVSFRVDFDVNLQRFCNCDCCCAEFTLALKLPLISIARVALLMPPYQQLTNRLL